MYLLSLTVGAHHPLLPIVLDEVTRWISQDGYLDGITDSAHHPIYQTQWLKLGLRSLALPWTPGLLYETLRSQGISLSNLLCDKIQRLRLESYPVGVLEDTYAALCWWEREGIPIVKPGGYFSNIIDYPYLGWAEAHFHHLRPPKVLSSSTYPLTWETNASQADYSKMTVIFPEFVHQKIAMPHTWHAAEMFLYLIKHTRRLI